MVKYALKIFEKNLQLMLDISIKPRFDKFTRQNVLPRDII